jgi:hypothetical protein
LDIIYRAIFIIHHQFKAKIHHKNPIHKIGEWAMFPVKHGVFRLLKHGQMPSGRGLVKVKRYAETIEDRIIESKGGVKRITPLQELLIHSTVRAFKASVLIDIYINKEGPVVKHLLKRGIVELQPCLKSYATFLNVVRQNAIALGLEGREAEKVFTLPEYVKAHDMRQKAKAKAAAKSAKQPGEAQVPRVGQGGNGSDKQEQGPEARQIEAPGSTSSEIQDPEEVKHE